MLPHNDEDPRDEEDWRQPNAPLWQLTIKIPGTLSGWETLKMEFRLGDTIHFETPIVLPETRRVHHLPAGFQSPIQVTKLVDVYCGEDCDMTIRVDNTCLWAFDQWKRDTDEVGFLVGTPLKHMRNRVCPHCGIEGVDEKANSKFVAISKWTAPWWSVCDVNLSEPRSKPPMHEN